jgi:hypothetical protein
MSFDLHLQHFASGDSSPVDPSPVRAALTKRQHNGPDEFGFYNVEFLDGVSAEFSASGLDGSEPFSGCAFHIRGVGQQLVEFVFDVAVAGDFVIFNCQGNDTSESPTLILVRPEQEKELPADMASEFAARPVCESARMLAGLLFEGYTRWSDYRDQVTGES